MVGFLFWRSRFESLIVVGALHGFRSVGQRWFL